MSEAPERSGLIALLRRIANRQNITAAVGLCTMATVVVGFVTWLSDRNARSAVSASQAAEFQVSVDKRLDALREWQVRTDNEREIVRNAIFAKLEALESRFNQRKEARDEQAAAADRRTTALEYRVCIALKVPVSQCK